MKAMQNAFTPTTAPGTPPRWWQRLATDAVRWFHSYGNWLVGITWKRFFLLAILLMICAGVLSQVPPFSLPISSYETVTVRPRPEPMPAAGGSVYHVYPPGFKGAKIEPSFE